ncbi:hypothetical protein ACO0RG_000389 [Hanseniaspora osmophila]
MKQNIPTFTLKSGDKLPAIGFGAGTKWRIAKAEGSLDFIQELADQVSCAIRAGFTMIDCAEAYKTHLEVGSGLRDAGITKANRNTVWITDKYTTHSFAWRKGTGPVQSLQLALEKMQLEYVDLYLLHTPTINLESAGITLEDAWKQCEELQRQGLAKNIGVSNFGVSDLEKIYKICTIEPAVNQIEFHAYLQQQSPGIRSFCKDKNIQLQAYSPLTPITKAASGPLDPYLNELAQKYGKTCMQILLRWVIQNGVVALTTSGKEERIQESLDIFDFELSPKEIEKINKIGQTFFHRGWMERFLGHFGKEECNAGLENAAFLRSTLTTLNK